jgi:hypothetical protein
VDEQKVDKIRAIYPRGQRPDPALMSPRFARPDKNWIPLHGPYKGQVGAEHCATEDFEWVGLVFPGETGYHAFRADDLDPAG